MMGRRLRPDGRTGRAHRLAASSVVVRSAHADERARWGAVPADDAKSADSNSGVGCIGGSDAAQQQLLLLRCRLRRLLPPPAASSASAATARLAVAPIRAACVHAAWSSIISARLRGATSWTCSPVAPRVTMSPPGVPILLFAVASRASPLAEGTNQGTNLGTKTHHRSRRSTISARAPMLPSGARTQELRAAAERTAIFHQADRTHQPAS